MLFVVRVKPLAMKAQCLFYDVAYTPVAAGLDGYVVADFLDFGGGICGTCSHATMAHHLVVGDVVSHTHNLRFCEAVFG